VTASLSTKAQAFRGGSATQRRAPPRQRLEERQRRAPLALQPRGPRVRLRGQRRNHPGERLLRVPHLLRRERLSMTCAPFAPLLLLLGALGARPAP
jgi:hypothetical protein